jgi:hypothetical protein
MPDLASHASPPSAIPGSSRSGTVPALGQAAACAKPDRIRAIKHCGDFYTIAGPLNLLRCPVRLFHQQSDPADQKHTEAAAERL